MSLRVKPTVFLMNLSTSVQLASATARGRVLCKTGEFKRKDGVIKGGTTHLTKKQGGWKHFADFLNFHQIFHRFTLKFPNTSLQVLKA